MTDQSKPLMDVGQLRADLAEAQAALASFADGPAKQAAATLSDSFAQAGTRIAASLTRAASDGKVTLKELAKVILEELARISLPQLTQRIGGQSSGFFGARAAGGSVAQGGSYLVGERGPELFTPRAAGSLRGAHEGALTVHVNVAAGADAEGFLRHRAQISADIARAVAYGRRNL
jgi:phage-related minor tail protein